MWWGRWGKRVMMGMRRRNRTAFVHATIVLHIAFIRAAIATAAHIIAHTAIAGNRAMVIGTHVRTRCRTGRRRWCDVMRGRGRRRPVAGLGNGDAGAKTKAEKCTNGNFQ